MRKSKVLNKFRNGKFARICGLGHLLPFFVRHAAHFHYDGIWLDLEHRTLEPREIQALLTYSVLHNIDCMIRPATLERTCLYHYLEDGAAGFMIPFVSTPEIARQVVNAVKFPPDGNRGVDGAGLDGDYVLESWRPGNSYFAEANHQTFIVAQIETLEGLENVDAIAAVAGIDCLFVGPGDLGLRLATSQTTLPQAIERVAASAARHKKAWGITAGTLEDLARYRKMGAQMVPWGGDFHLMKVLEKCSNELNEVLGPEQ